jgi:uncharacterized protein (DUF849 family)
MTPVIISSIIHDALLGTPASLDHVSLVKAAKASVDSGATALSLRVPDVHEDGAFLKELAAIVTTLKQDTEAVLELSLFGKDPALTIEALRDAESLPDVIALYPEHVDLVLSSGTKNIKQTMEKMRAAVELCANLGITLGLEVFHTGGVWLAQGLREKNLLPATMFCQVPFNVPGNAWSPPEVPTMAYRVSDLPPGAVVSAYAYTPGRDESSVHWKLAALALGLGHHLRTGQSACPFTAEGSASTHAQLVGEAAELVARVGRSVADIAGTRSQLGMA